jgi:hypothetical protein
MRFSPRLYIQAAENLNSPIVLSEATREELDALLREAVEDALARKCVATLEAFGVEI